MIFANMKMNIQIDDLEFNTIYPEPIRNLASKHWTPIDVAKQAAEFLAYKSGVKILDIGSGAGKFCLVGSVCTLGHFTGVEQRENLFKLSIRLIELYNLHNVKFIHSSITEINFKEYDGFYFYNSFYENLNQAQAIDKKIELSDKLYVQYFKYLWHQLDDMPIGTRLVTYWVNLRQIPPSFEVVSIEFNGKLLKWVKTR